MSTVCIKARDKNYVQNFGWNKPVRIPRGKVEDNIKMDVKGIMWKSVDCIYLAQERDGWWVL
jgi:hypothetical protein